MHCQQKDWGNFQGINFFRGSWEHMSAGNIRYFVVVHEGLIEESARVIRQIASGMSMGEQSNAAKSRPQEERSQPFLLGAFRDACIRFPRLVNC